MENLTLGHTIEPGNCAGAVLEFNDCREVHLQGLDLYGCGTFGVDADSTEDLILKSCIIRDCSYGIIDLVSCEEVLLEDCTMRDNRGYTMVSLKDSSALFRTCSFTGNLGDSFLPSNDYVKSQSKADFEDCTFGWWEMDSMVGGMDYFGDDTTVTGDFAWSDMAGDEEEADGTDAGESTGTDADRGDSGVTDASAEPEPLDTTVLSPVPFDSWTLRDHEYYIFYQKVDRESGEVWVDTGEDVDYLTFGEDGRGAFWTSDEEKGRFFSYMMDSAYSCTVTFDDGQVASVGLYADRSGAESEGDEAQIWMAMYFDSQVLWFY